MKHLHYLSLALLATLLAACGRPTQSQAAKNAEFKVVQTEEQTAVYRYSQTANNLTQTITETIVYQGEEFVTLKLELSQPLSTDAQAIIASQGLDAVKPQLISILESEEFIVQLKSVPGVDVTVDVPNETEMVAGLTIDMESVNLAALSNIDGVGFDFTALENTTPTQYLAHLEKQGASRIDS